MKYKHPYGYRDRNEYNKWNASFAKNRIVFSYSAIYCGQYKTAITISGPGSGSLGLYGNHMELQRVDE